jgi:hypothetical protein
MAKKNTALIIAGLAAGAYAFLRKQENRDKAVEAFSNTKNKVNEMLDQKSKESVTTADDREQVAYGANPDTDPEKSYYLRDRDMIGEGAMTTVQYYNEGKQEEADVTSEHNLEDNKNKMTLDADKPSPKVAAPEVNYRPDGINDKAHDETQHTHDDHDNGDDVFTRDRNMIDEGAMTSVQYYNEEQEKKDKK